MEGDVITLQGHLRLREAGLSPENRVLGRFAATGSGPKFLRSFWRRASG